MEQQNNQAHQAGQYLGVLSSTKTGTTPKSQSPVLILNFRATHIADNGQWRQLEQPIEDADVWIVLSDKSWQFAAEHLQKLGWNGSLDQPQFSLEELRTGTVLECSVKYGDYASYNQWGLSIIEGGGSNIGQLDQSKKKQIEQMFKTHMTNAGGGQSPQQTQPQPQSNTPQQQPPAKQGGNTPPPNPNNTGNNSTGNTPPPNDDIPF